MTWWGKDRRASFAYWSAGLALIAGLFLRLYFVHHRAEIAGDSLVYGDLATNMLSHHIYGLSVDTVRSSLIRLPGYPLLLAAFFAVFGIGNYTAVLYAQVALDLGTCLLVAALARRLMGDTAALWALWLGALCPFTANYTATPLTETWSLFFLALAFYSMERWWTGAESARWMRRGWTWPLACSLAFAVMLRPDRLLLAAAVAPAMLWVALRSKGSTHQRFRRSRLIDVGIVVLIVLLPLCGWTARNWRVFHVFQPLAPRYANDPGELVNFGFQRWYRTWAIDFKSTYDVYWSYDGTPLVLEDLPARAFDSAAQQAETSALLTRYNGANMATSQLDSDFASIAKERVAAHPFRSFLELPVLRVANMWLRPRTEMLPLPLDWWNFRAHPVGSSIAAGLGALNLAYLVLAAAGLWRWRRQGWSRRRAFGYALVAFVLMRSAMLLTMDNSEPRYTIDCYPIVILLAAFALAPKRIEMSSMLVGED